MSSINFNTTFQRIDDWQPTDPDTLGLFRSLVMDLNDEADWVQDAPTWRLGELITGEDDDHRILRRRIERQLSGLQWFDDAEVSLLVSIRQAGERQRDHELFGNDMDVVLVDIEVGDGMRVSQIPRASLTKVRDECIDHFAELADSVRDLRHDLVLLTTIHGPQYDVPELALVGPSEPDDEEGEPNLVKTLYLPLARELRKSAGDTSSLRGELGKLANLAAGNEDWRVTFDKAASSMAALRRQFRNRMKGCLTDLMTLIEEAADEDRVAKEDLESLREAATLVAYRLMFLLEVNRRTILYTDDHDGPSLLELAEDPGDDDRHVDRPAGALLQHLQHLTHVLRGDADDAGVGLRGASIFENRPAPEFDDRTVALLEPLDVFEQPIEDLRDNFDRDFLERWDQALSKTGAVVTGQLDDYVQLNGSASTGFGGAQHSHRVLGDVYEQILAMVPERDDDDEIQLSLASHHSDDERKALGAHYTPPGLVEEVVRPALGHIFEQVWDDCLEEHGAGQGEPADPDALARDYMLRIQQLRFVDPAMGSAHFLTVTALEIAREIAWAETTGEPRPFDRHEALDYEESVPLDQLTDAQVHNFNDRVRQLLPDIVQSCAYGVDIKPLACELGKLSLWLFTLAVSDQEEPDLEEDLAYLNTNIKCGDSLIGLTLEQSFETIQNFLRSSAQDAANLDLFRSETFADRKAKVERLRGAARLPAGQLADQIDDLWGEFPEYLPDEAPESLWEVRDALEAAARQLNRSMDWLYDLAVLAKYHGYTSSRSGKSSAKALYDAMTDAENPDTGVAGVDSDEAKDELEHLIQRLLDDPFGGLPDDLSRVTGHIQQAADDLHAFHWELEFPDVFGPSPGERSLETGGGFDVLLANPPFIGDRDVRQRIGGARVEYLRDLYTDGKTPDFAGFFFLKYDELLNDRGSAGTLGPNSIAQASNRDYVMRPLALGQRDDAPPFAIQRALPNRPWPGEANVHYCMVHFVRENTDTNPLIVAPADDHSLDSDDWEATSAPGGVISSFLDEYPDFDLRSLPSMPNRGVAYTGMFLRGDFSIHKHPTESYDSAVERIPAEERDALAAYLNYEDVQQNPRPQPSKIVIDFYEPLMAAELAEAGADDQLKWLEEQYPTLVEQLRTQNPWDEDHEPIYEARTSLRSSSDNDPHKEYWFLFGRVRKQLKARWAGLDAVTAYGNVTKVWTPIYLPKRIGKFDLRICPMHQWFITPIASPTWLGITAAFPFESIARRHCSTLEDRLRFSPTEVFPFYPMPWQPGWNKDEGRPSILPIPTDRPGLERISKISDELVDHRRAVLENPTDHDITDIPGQWGPTKLYNLYDDEDCQLDGINRLRQLHVELLEAVLRAYGWDDLAAACTWSPDAPAADNGWTFARPWIDRTPRFVPRYELRGEMLDRLADLNQQRYTYELDLYRPHLLEAMRQDDARDWYSISALKTLCDDAGIDIDDNTDLPELLDRATEGGALETKIYRGTDQWRPS